MPSTNRLYFYLRILLFAAYFINGIYYINHNSVTSDEGDHLGYGIRVLKGHPEKVLFDDASTLPISALNAIPRAVEQVAKPGLKKSDGGVSDIVNGRYISLLICLLAAILVFRWSRELFGEEAGLFSLFLFVFCPNINGHIPLVATDGYAMLFVISSAYYFRKFVLSSGWQNFILFSVHLSLAQISKQSLVLLFFFYGTLALIILIQRGIFSRVKVNLLRAVLLFVIFVLIVNLAFIFKGTGCSLSQYNFRSELFQQLQEMPVISRVPIPLPVPFLEGFDQVKNMLSMGSGNENVSPRSYLLGSYFTGNEKWYYYLVLILFKTPLLPLLLLFLVTVNYLVRDRKKNIFTAMGYPLLLAMFFLISVSLLNRSQHGIRHLLMLYPLFYICLGQLMNRAVFKKWVTRIIIAAYSMISFYYYFPNLIAYTNELIWRKERVYKIMDGTTIDHFQASYSFTGYLQKHPEVKARPEWPAAGKYIISVNDYLDLKGTGQYQWLRNFEPYGHVNFCYLLLSVTEEDLKRIK